MKEFLRIKIIIPMKKYLTIRMIAQAAVIAAMYVVVTLAFGFLSGFQGNFQLRFAEAMTLLPVLTPAAIPGLFVGCVLANLLGGATILDVVFGSLATVIAALVTRRMREKPLLAALPPVAFNMVIVGLVLSLSFNLPFLPTAGWVGLGQVCACYGLGLPLLWALKKTGIHFDGKRGSSLNN